MIGGLLTSLFTSLLTWLGTYLTKKIAFGVASVTAMTTVTVALYVALRTVVAGLSAYSFGLPPLWTMVLGLAIPPAAPFCLSSYMTIWTAVTVYSWQKDALHFFRGAV